MDFPKYLKDALENGQVHFFREDVISPLEEYDTPWATFCLFFSGKGDEKKQREKAITLAEKIIAFQKRDGGSGFIGSEDWFWFKEVKKERYATTKPLDAVKVNFIKFALKGSVNKAIWSLKVTTAVNDISYGGNKVCVSGKIGYLLRPCRTSFLTECDKRFLRSE